jgi:hemolysin type calcium-binding protein
VFSRIYDTSSITLRRTLIAGNSATKVGDEMDKAGGSVTANNHNLFGHSGLSAAQAFANFTPDATDITATSEGTNTPLSAILEPTLANNGGPTETQNLVPGSLAIDASPVDAACLPTDQRGVARPQGPACDIGAVEFTSLPGTGETCGPPTLGCTVNGVPNQLCRGTAGDDVIVGTPGPDVILGLGGHNILKGGKGADCIEGRPGDDRLEGEDGADVLFGGGGHDEVRGGKGRDVIVTGSGDDRVQGDEGNDVIRDAGGENLLRGRAGDDVIIAPGTTGTIDGGSGSDVCVGGTVQKSCP